MLLDSYTVYYGLRELAMGQLITLDSAIRKHAVVGTTVLNVEVVLSCYWSNALHFKCDVGGSCSWGDMLLLVRVYLAYFRLVPRGSRLA